MSLCLHDALAFVALLQESFKKAIFRLYENIYCSKLFLLLIDCMYVEWCVAVSSAFSGEITHYC